MAGYDPYGSSAAGSAYGMAPDLQFYSGSGSGATSGTGLHASATTGMGSLSHTGPAGASSSGGGAAGVNYYADATGSMQSMGGPSGIGGVMLQQGGFWSAFTAAPVYENEPPLLEGGSQQTAGYLSLC